MLDPRLRYFHRTFGCIPFLVPYWQSEEFAAVKRTLANGTAESAERARTRLARTFHDRLGFEHVVLTSTGRYGIQVALASLDRAGGEVIIPTLACRAIATAVMAAGCTPVFADVNDDLTLSYDSVVSNLTPETIAVIVAHLSGKPAQDLDALVALCRDRNLALIDDAAQALGVRHDGQLLGTFGDFGILSFGLGKPTFSIGGGAIILRDDRTRRRCQTIVDRCSADAASRVRTFWDVTTFLTKYSYRERTLPATLAVHGIRKLLRRGSRVLRSGPIGGLEAELQVLQLEKLPRILHAFRANAASVIERAGPLLDIPQRDVECGYSKCLVQAPAGRGGSLARHLWRNGIETEWSYKPLGRLEEFARFRRYATPRAERVSQDLLAVPVHPALTASDVDRVGACVASFR